MAELKSNLECSICLDLYTEPVALPCMHSFCRDCLSDYFTSKAKPNITNDTKVKTPCPNCKELYPLSKNMIRGMQKNFQLQSIVESYQKHHQTPEIVKCDLCTENAATQTCSKCDVSYCEACLETYHPPNRLPFSKHTLNLTVIGGGGSPLGSPSKGPIGAAGGKDASADSSGSRPAKAIKSQFRQDVEDISCEVQRVNRYISELNDSKLQVKKKAKSLEDEIMIEGRKLKERIGKIEKDHTAAITEETKQKLSEVDGKVKDYQDYVRKQEDLIAAIKVLLKEPDENAFLKTAATMRTKVQSSKQNKPRHNSDTTLVQGTESVEAFKRISKHLMQDEKMPPATPGLSREQCICQDTSVAIFLPMLNINVPETNQIDMIKYRYKTPTETDWIEGRAHAEQIERDGLIKVDSLTSATSYSFSIKAHNPFGWSQWSKIALVQTSGKQGTDETHSELKSPSPPKINTSATKAESEKVTLKWFEGEENDADIVAYTPESEVEKWTYLVTQKCDNTCTITGLTPGGSYLFKVGGCGKNGFTTWSKKVRIRMQQKVTPIQPEYVGTRESHVPKNDPIFDLDKDTANPCLVISHMTIAHPMNACPSVSDGFTGNSYSVFGNTIITSGLHYWQVTINGMGSKVRLGIAKPDVSKNKLLGTDRDAWVLVLDMRHPLFRQGSHVFHDSIMHKSGGDWIPFSRYIGVTLDYNKERVAFAIFDGPPSPTTRRTNHIYEFNPPPKLRPVFAIDEKSEMTMEVKTGISMPMPRCRPGSSRKDIDDMNRELLQQCVQQ